MAARCGQKARAMSRHERKSRNEEGAPQHRGAKSRAEIVGATGKVGGHGEPRTLL
jgi:hypothetical protein